MGDCLPIVHIILSFDSQPVIALSGKHVVSALTFVNPSNPKHPIVAKESMENGRRIESCHYETANVRNESD